MQKIIITMMVLMLGAAYPAGANLLLNAGFETQGATEQDAESWTGWGGIGRAPWQHNEGDWAVAFYANEVSSGWFQDTAADSITPGNEYVASAWFFNDNNATYGYSNMMSEIKMEWYDSSDNAIGTAASFTFDTPGEIWTYHSVTGTAPVLASYARFVSYAGDSGQAAGSANAGSLYMDSTTLTQAIPEPMSVTLLAVGAGVLWMVRRRRR